MVICGVGGLLLAAAVAGRCADSAAQLTSCAARLMHQRAVGECLPVEADMPLRPVYMLPTIRCRFLPATPHLSMPAGSADALFTPVQVGAHALKHRIVYAPLTRCRAFNNIPQVRRTRQRRGRGRWRGWSRGAAAATLAAARLPPALRLRRRSPRRPHLPSQPAAAKYYAQRATEGGLMITEATVVSERGHGARGSPPPLPGAARSLRGPALGCPRALPTRRAPPAACRVPLHARDLHAGAGRGLEAHRGGGRDCQSAHAHDARPLRSPSFFLVLLLTWQGREAMHACSHVAGAAADHPPPFHPPTPAHPGGARQGRRVLHAALARGPRLTPA